MSEHSAQVEALLVDYRRSREALTSVRRELAAVRATATSSDGLVTAAAGAHGGLLELTIAESAYTRYRPAELSAVIVRTTAAAGKQAAEQASQVLAPVLPDGGDPELLLPDAPKPAAPQRGSRSGGADTRDDEDDVDLGERSWINDWRPA